MLFTTRRTLATLAFVACTLLALQPAAAQKTELDTVTVFAAASLKNALDGISPEFEKATGKKLSISYAASSALAKQIEQGAPADVFISADLDWMDYLAGKSLIKADTRSNLLGNSIVLIAPSTSTAELKIAKDFPLATALGGGKLAMADVKAVPAGKYGKAALEALGVWTSVEASIAQAENVRAALNLVARGEAALGIVYKTDAAAEPKVKIVGTFPPETHPPIVYPIAVTKDAKNEAGSKALLGYLASDSAKPRFVKEGFTVLK